VPDLFAGADFGDGFNVLIKNYDESYKWSFSSDIGEISFDALNHKVYVRKMNVGQIATLTVTASRDGLPTTTSTIKREVFPNPVDVAAAAAAKASADAKAAAEAAKVATDLAFQNCVAKYPKDPNVCQVAAQQPNGVENCIKLFPTQAGICLGTEMSFADRVAAENAAVAKIAQDLQVENQAKAEKALRDCLSKYPAELDACKLSSQQPDGVNICLKTYPNKAGICKGTEISAADKAAADKAAADKKTVLIKKKLVTISCRKGKIVRKISGYSPTCPSGYLKN
jgi:hypothetical protein